MENENTSKIITPVFNGDKTGNHIGKGTVKDAVEELLFLLRKANKIADVISTVIDNRANALEQDYDAFKENEEAYLNAVCTAKNALHVFALTAIAVDLTDTERLAGGCETVVLPNWDINDNGGSE